MSRATPGRSPGLEVRCGGAPVAFACSRLRGESMEPDFTANAYLAAICSTLVDGGAASQLLVSATLRPN